MPKFSGFLTKKNCCANITSLQKKTIRNSCNPKELPIYFSMIKKMPLNILQQKLQIYTQTGSSRGQWSHWFVCFSVHPPPFKNCILTIDSKQIILPSCWFFTILLWFDVFESCQLTATWPRTSTQNYERKEKNEYKHDILYAGRFSGVE